MNARLARLPAPGGNRAVIYLRQSTYREESISLEVQEQAAREHCKRNGYDVVRVEADPGISGRTWKQRRGVQNALGAVQAGEADVIVVWRWSRLSRNRRDWAVAADAADLAGGRIESATEPNDATAAGRFARGVMTELAAFESERIGEQWNEAREHRVARGLPATGGTRFGYRLVDGAYEVDPELGPVLAEAYRLYLGGWGASQITRYLTDQGTVRSRKPWTYSSVRAVLDSGFGAGLLVRHAPLRPGTKTRPHVTPWETTYVPGAHAAVITEEEWAAYVAARKARSRTVTRHTRYFLSGVLRCAECDGPMHGRLDKSRNRVGYTCTRATTTPGKRSNFITARIVEEKVEAWLLGLAGDVEERADAIAATEEAAERADFAQRRARALVGQADARLAALTVKLADGTITDAAYRLAADAIEAEAEAARALIVDTTPNPVRQAAPATLPNDLARLWPSMTPEQRNLVLRPLVHAVIVRPGAHRGDRTDRVTIVPAWEA